MLNEILSLVANWTINIISTFGYPGVFICMTIESALIPLPSEIIMPFSGYLVSTGQFSLLGISLAGAFGNLTGSLIAYALGYWGKEKVVRRFLRKYGKWILHTEHDLDKTTTLFKKRGEAIAFFTRLLPGIRTVISLPAGIAAMPMKRFIFYTFTGSFIWSLFLGYLGKVMGDNWETLGSYFHKIDFIIVALGVVGGVGYIWYKWKDVKKQEEKEKEVV